MKAIIVARVSTEEQKEAGNSLPAQLNRMQDYCERNKYEIIEVFSFDESAYKTKRDEFDKIIECIGKTKEKVAVCFDKVDRLSRNIFDKRVALLYEKAIENEIELHFISDNQVINNKMGAGDKFAFGMKLGLSKYYSDAISDNVKRAFEQKRRSGEWTGSVRLGYLNIHLDKEKRLRKDIIVDPERSHFITKMFEMYSTGNYSLETIRKEVTNLGLRSINGYELSKSSIENLLKDSFYCGIAISKKYGPYPHKYPCLISRELFERCHAVRESRNLRPQKFATKEFIFKGLLTCNNCGCSMTPEIKTKKSGLVYTYYSCTNSKGTCKREYVSEKALLEPIYEVLDQFQGITLETQNMLVSELRKETESEVAFHITQTKRINIEYRQLKEKDNRLLDTYLEQNITKEVYEEKHQEYHSRLQRLNIELEEHTKADYDYQTTVATVFSLARRTKEIFESSEIHEKRQFLNYLLQNPTVEQKTLMFQLRSPFNLILDTSSKSVLGR